MACRSSQMRRTCRTASSVPDSARVVPPMPTTCGGLTTRCRCPPGSFSPSLDVLRWRRSARDNRRQDRWSSWHVTGRGRDRSTPLRIHELEPIRFISDETRRLATSRSVHPASARSDSSRLMTIRVYPQSCGLRNALHRLGVYGQGRREDQVIRCDAGETPAASFVRRNCVMAVSPSRSGSACAIWVRRGARRPGDVSRRCRHDERRAARPGEGATAAGKATTASAPWGDAGHVCGTRRIRAGSALSCTRPRFTTVAVLRQVRSHLDEMPKRQPLLARTTLSLSRQSAGLIGHCDGAVLALHPLDVERVHRGNHYHGPPHRSSGPRYSADGLRQD